MDIAMKFILNTPTIIISLIFLFLININSLDVVVRWSHQLDKEKRELIKRLHIKTETETLKKIIQNDSVTISVWIYKNKYAENGNQLSYEAFKDSLSINSRYEEEYITDDMGNVIEAYRKGKLIGTQEFDNEGRIIELINYDEDEEVCWTWEYEYDEVGNNTLEIKYLYGNLVDTLVHNQFEYETIRNKSLIKSKVSLLEPSKPLYEGKQFFKYDSLGREINYQEFDDDGNIYLERSIDYNSLLRIRKFYHSDRTIEQIDSMKINPDGKVIERFTYKNGNLIKTHLFVYSQQGLPLSELVLSQSGQKLFEYKYNELGLETDFKSFVSDSLKYMRTSKYLINELILESKTIDLIKGTIELKTYEYEYF